jgi:hypothetical protein
MPIDVTDTFAQSQRALAGDKLEKVCIRVLNDILTGSGIVVLKGTRKALEDYFKSEPIAQQIVDFNRLPVKRPCDQKQLEDYPDTDLFVLLREPSYWRVLGLISCKVSFHARHTMVTFWGLAIRISSNIPYVCVTEDANIYRGGTSELGVSCSEPTAARRLLESFTDGVYTIKQYQSHDSRDLIDDLKRFKEGGLGNRAKKRRIVFDDYSVPNHTKYCQSVRPFDDLIFDILRWKEES